MKPCTITTCYCNQSPCKYQEYLKSTWIEILQEEVNGKSASQIRTSIHPQLLCKCILELAYQLQRIEEKQNDK